MSNYFVSQQFTDCDLHIPYKRWADEPQEEQNYEAIERWAYRFQRDCLPSAGATFVSRATYGHDHSWYDYSGTNYNPGPPPNTNVTWEWGVTALSNDLLNDRGVFGTNQYGRVVFNFPGPVLLPINRAGLLSWHGYVDATAAYPGPGHWNLAFDSYIPSGPTINNLQQITQREVPSGAPQGDVVAFGGSYYVEAGTQLEFVLNHTLTGTHAFDVRVMFTHLEFG